MSDARQLTLSFAPDILERNSSLLECITAGVYQRGLKRVAGDLDKAPGNLSRELSGDSDRHFSVNALERYIQTSGDKTPIYYLIARYLGDEAATEGATLKRIETLLAEATNALAQQKSKRK